MDVIIVELVKKLFEMKKDILDDSDCGRTEYNESLDIFESEIREIIARQIKMDKYSLAVSAYIHRK